MPSARELQNLLQRCDGRGYKAYKDIQGAYQLPLGTLYIDHVQSDPFAPPSRARFVLQRQSSGVTERHLELAEATTVIEDYLLRCLAGTCRKFQTGKGSGGSGSLHILQPGQKILQRSALRLDEKQLEIRFAVGLPAQGRRIDGNQAQKLLLHQLPAWITAAIGAQSLDAETLVRHIETYNDQQALRRQLDRHNLLAFVADGALLPRESGASDRPLNAKQAVRSQSPPSLQVTLDTPHSGPVSGMGIYAGVNLIVGGGYHGKSTLLQALQYGVYNHVPADGREKVVTREDACKIRAEDGRSVTNVDICPFIRELPGGTSTKAFTSPNASGSTSQAANILETLEAGSRLLLLDEDTCATNFLIRDSRMQQLVAKEHEPITPFIDRVQQLFQEHGVATIMVLGGCGDYFDVADTIIQYKEYRPYEVTSQAHEIANHYPTHRHREAEEPIAITAGRPLSWKALGLGDREKIRAQETRRLLYGKEEVDLSALEQLVEPGQTRVIAQLLPKLAAHKPPQGQWPQWLQEHLQELANQDFQGLTGGRPANGDWVLPRVYEVCAVLNRLRRWA